MAQGSGGGKQKKATGTAGKKKTVTRAAGGKTTAANVKAKLANRKGKGK